MNTQPNNKEDLDFDPEALRRKYRAERDKRIRPDGISQYKEMAGEFSNYIEDPYIKEKINRAPLLDEVDVVVIVAINSFITHFIYFLLPSFYRTIS